MGCTFCNMMLSTDIYFALKNAGVIDRCYPTNRQLTREETDELAHDIAKYHSELYERIVFFREEIKNSIKTADKEEI